MAFHFYSRKSLLLILLSIRCIPQLDCTTWRILKENGIARTITRRGCRAGAQKQREIRTVQGFGKYNAISTCNSYLAQTNSDFEVEFSSAIVPSQNIQPKRPSSRDFQQSSHGTRNIKNLINIPLSRQQQPRNSLSTKFGLLNIRSMKNKTTQICDLIISNRLDILALTETWLNGTDMDNRCFADINNTLPNYTIHHVPRLNRKGGGVALIIRDGFSVVKNSLANIKSFEYQDVTLSYKNDSMRIVNIYRPPSNKINVDCFLSEFSTLTEHLTITQCPLLISGDFNLHLDDKANTDASKFNQLIESTDLTQHITESAHKHGLIYLI